MNYTKHCTVLLVKFITSRQFGENETEQNKMKFENAHKKSEHDNNNKQITLNTRGKKQNKC